MDKELTMTFTYSGDPSASPVDQTRFEIQDTDPGAPLLQDAEIQFAIDIEAPDLTAGQLFGAAARCCEVLARRFAMQADEEIGDLKTTWSKQAQTYQLRAVELRAKSQGMYSPYALLSRSAKCAARSDPDRVQGAFRRGQFENPSAGPGGDDGPFR